MNPVIGFQTVEAADDQRAMFGNHSLGADVAAAHTGLGVIDRRHIDLAILDVHDHLHLRFAIVVQRTRNHLQTGARRDGQNVSGTLGGGRQVFGATEVDHCRLVLQGQDRRVADD